jgi:two-component system OmpR family sensor kinase
VGIIASLVSFGCLGIGAGTLIALHRFLIEQLDEQVLQAALRSQAFFDGGPPRAVRFFGPGPIFLDGPGQSAGTVGGLISGGHVSQAAVILANGDRRALPPAAAELLSRVPIDHGTSLDLDGIGYRLTALRTDGGFTLVAGLPSGATQDALASAEWIICALVAVVLILTVLGGFFSIRRELVPLSRIASAAQRVAGLPLDQGEVHLPSPIADVDAAGADTEIGRLSAALNQMVDRIADAMAARHHSETRVRQFVADASHELRTPLTSISGYTEMARRLVGDMPEDLVYALSRVQAESLRMSRLVEDMLLLARLDEGRPLDRDEVDLSQLIIDTVSDAHAAGPEHRWALDLPDEPVLAHGDRLRLHQALANLLSNARLHTPPGTMIVTALAGNGDESVTFSVTDDGPGIEASQLADVFERFSRGDGSRSRLAGGTGLGLAITRAIVKAHDGTIAVSSFPGATTFAVSLPARAAASFEFAEARSIGSMPGTTG